VKSNIKKMEFSEEQEMKTLITGGSGKLGRELKKIFPKALTPTHNQLDIIDCNSVFSYIKMCKPDLLLHTAALTGIRDCEADKKMAFQVNVDGTNNLIKACLKSSPTCCFVYLSTACVFYGDKGGYTEDDIPHPKNYYALSKLLGEFVVLASPLKKWLIVRTNFVDRAKWEYEKAFSDRFGTYLYADDLALAIADVMRRKLTGIVHICGDKKTSMFEIAKLTTPEIKSMTITDYNGPPLTMDMSLNSIRIKPYRMRPS
jgi:dTDP-4-dehydrorhamnose reductase